MKVNINKLGEEIICDALVKCDYLNNLPKLKDICLGSLKKGECGMVDNQVLFHQFTTCENSPHVDGITGLVIIKESHFHISTWPEHNYVQININTCGNTAKPMIALGHLLHDLQVVRSTFEIIERGVLQD